MTSQFITATIPCASFNSSNWTFLYKNIEGTFLTSSQRKNYNLRTNDQGGRHFWWRPWRSTEGTVIWEQDWTLRPEAKRILGERLRWQERLRTLEKTRGVYEFAKNCLKHYWRIKMLSSALRVGFSRVSMAAKRCLVPTINAGNFIIVLEHTFSFSKNCVHVELAVRGYCCYTQGL